MLLVKTYIAPVKGKGIGLFADEDIPENTLWWEWNTLIDKAILGYDLDNVPKVVKDHVLKYAVKGKYNRYFLCGDHAIFVNHSDDPNTYENDSTNSGVGTESFASRDIKRGEEITQDYREFKIEYPLGILDFKVK